MKKSVLEGHCSAQLGESPVWLLLAIAFKCTRETL